MWTALFWISGLLKKLLSRPCSGSSPWANARMRWFAATHRSTKFSGSGWSGTSSPSLRSWSAGLSSFSPKSVFPPAVTNGTVTAQNKKLTASGLKDLLDGAFLSEGVGAEKPNMAFFDAVFDAIRPTDLSKVLIIGDSLTSDIRGGNNAGIRTCWYNPDHLPARPGFRIDYTISDLREVLDIL